MADLTIRNLDDKVIERLKRRAKANNRSLEDEVRDLLEQSVKPMKAMSREEFIKEARRIRAMTPDVPQTDSTILLREDRDSDHGRDS